MATVHDVAAYILKKHGRMSAMKLQKLVYYCQAWSLVWDDRPLFKERIKAWANGPVVPALYELHRGKFDVSKWPSGDIKRLDDTARETIDIVINCYAKHSAQWLSDLTHSEEPWKNARLGLADGERGDSVIANAALMDYYANLEADE